jgi:hypothetical protein
MNNPIREYTIPLLPCNSIQATLAFYQALGFEVSYQQQKPNVYAAIKLRDIELHFFVIKALKPASNFSSCYIVAQDVDTMYESFTTGIRNVWGKLPVKGIPRINPLKDMPFYGVRQFIVVDPTGNYIRVGQPIAKTDSLVYRENNLNKKHQGTKLEKSLEIASRLADAKGDFPAAAKALDLALKAEKAENDADSIHMVRALILRADVAVRMEDVAMAKKTIRQVEGLMEKIDSSGVEEETRLLQELKSLVSENGNQQI